MAGITPSHTFLGENAAILPIFHNKYDQPKNGKIFDINMRQIMYGTVTHGRSLPKDGLKYDYGQSDIGDVTGWFLWEVKDNPTRLINTIRQISAAITNADESETFGQGQIVNTIVKNANWEVDPLFKGLRTLHNPVWNYFPENGYFTAILPGQDESEMQHLSFSIDPRIIANNETRYSTIVTEYEGDKKALSVERSARVMSNWRVAHDGAQFVAAWNGNDTGAGGYFPMHGKAHGARGQSIVPGMRTKGVFAFGDEIMGGIFSLGHLNSDKHKLTTNKDGEAVNPLHLQKHYLVYENILKDGPYKYDFFTPAEDNLPQLAPVHHEFNYSTGKWDWVAEVPPLYVPDYPYDVPNDLIPPRQPPDPDPDPDPDPPTWGGDPGDPDDDIEEFIKEINKALKEQEEEEKRRKEHPADGIGGPGKGQPFDPEGDGDGETGEAEIPHEVRVHSITGGADRDPSKSGYDGAFGPSTIPGGKRKRRLPRPGKPRHPKRGGDTIPRPEDDPSIETEADPTPAPEPALDSEGNPVERSPVSGAPLGRTAEDDQELEDMKNRAKRRKKFNEENPDKVPVGLQVVGPPSYGRSPNAWRISGIAPMSEAGEWIYSESGKGRPHSQGGGPWKYGLPLESSMYISPPGYIVQGKADQSAYTTPFTIGYYDGHAGGTPATVAWGTPDQDNGTINGGPTLQATGTVGTQDLKISATDSAGTERTVRTTFNGQVLTTAGSVTDPAYTFSTDDDTGIYHYGTNQLGFVAGGDLGGGSRGVIKMTTSQFSPAEIALDLGALTAPWGTLYASDAQLSTIHVTGKATFDGVIDPPGLELDYQINNPNEVRPLKGTIFAKNDHQLYWVDENGNEYRITMEKVS